VTVRQTLDCGKFGTPVRSLVRAMPSAADWWQSLRWVLLVFTCLVALTLIGSFVSYERVVRSGHPWLLNRHCSGCFLCGMTRSFCAMSSGHWQQACEWNRGGPLLYSIFWAWLFLSAVHAPVLKLIKRTTVEQIDA